MSTQTLVAIIAAFASLAVALVTAWSSRRSQERAEATQRELTTRSEATQRELTRLTSELEERRAAGDARLSYVYEARKRLYAECEPILFQAGELAQEARARILSLARSSRDGEVRADGTGWLSRPGYYFHSTLFLLIVPLASYKLLQRRLTAIDLGLDPRLHTQYELLKLLFFSFTKDFELAKRDPRLPYDPDRADPDEPDRAIRLAQDPGRYERQGFYRGTLDRIVETLVKEAGETTRVGGPGSPTSRSRTFGEFMREVEDPEAAVAALLPDLSAVFHRFHPDRKPVLWRVLLTQALLYTVLLDFSRRRAGSTLVEIAAVQDVDELARELRWRPGSDALGADASREIAVASDYVRQALAAIDRSVGGDRLGPA